MSDMLTQAEIDALLNGSSLASSGSGGDKSAKADVLSPQEIDALGEIGNISMGTSATTLFTLLGHKVLITTPEVKVTNWTEMAQEYAKGYVAVKVEYTHGMTGTNLLILKEDDVKIITDIMMGGEGKKSDEELNDLHLSAISEAMNQMIGSAATSMSSMFNKRIDISPPSAFKMDFNKVHPSGDINESDELVKVSFKMVVGDLIDSRIMQIIPVSFAKTLVSNLLSASDESEVKNNPGNNAASPQAKIQPDMSSATPMQTAPQTPMQAAPQQMNMNMQGSSQSYGAGMQYNQDFAFNQRNGYMQNDQGGVYREPQANRAPVNVQPAQFQSFDESPIPVDKKNIGLIMDVPLEVTVELGRTNKLIKEILEFSTGTVIELDKIAGEPVDILVNGKPIAKGEVVVIDESFGVRVTDILHPSKRL